MALLNKLFFPSAPAPTPAAAAGSPTQAAAAAAAQSAAVQQSTTQFTATTATLINSQNTPTAASASTSRTHAASVGGVAGGNSSSSAKTRQTSRNYLSQFPFDGSQVRVLLYKEDDSRGRRLLFDSNALQKVMLKEGSGIGGSSHGSGTGSSSGSSGGGGGGGVGVVGKFVKNTSHQNGKLQNNKAHSNNPSNSTNFIEVCAEYGYKHNRPSSTDIASISEMVFGALAMSFCGTALKVHWLPEPARILCSQVFLTPSCSSSSATAAAAANGGAGHSPYSTLSLSSLATPRTSICSEHGSVDGLSMNSFNMPFSVSVGRQLSLTPSERSSALMTPPLDVPGPDQQSLSINSGSDSGPRFSSTYSNATDSGYSGLSSSRSGGGGPSSSSDQWSYQYSTRSSLGSVLSDQSDPLRKLSMDSAFFPSSSPHLSEFASDGCLQRRISRNWCTSFENAYSMNDLIGFVGDNCPLPASSGGAPGGSEGGNMAPPQYRRASYCANESRSNPEIGRRQGNLKRRAKLGLAVCITMSPSFEEEMELFCSEHIALLESMLSRLRVTTECAYINHKNFLQIMFQAWQDAEQWFNDLFTAPRIKTPVWLSITTSGSKYSKTVAERFIKELCDLLSFADTKDSNFFISTMLTGILTYHLGWVATVSAFNTSSSRRSEASTAAIEQRAKLLQVSQKHPYNALWAQMGDLYGAIGIPPKLARTVIYGTEKLWVEKLLNVLTYFIRCGEVRRAAKREDFNKELINNLVSQSNSDKLKKSTVSSHSSRVGSGTRRSPAHESNTVSIGGAGLGGLTRTATCKQNLNAIADDGELSNGEEQDDDQLEQEEGSDEGYNNETLQLIGTLKKNDIPTVLAFRDSHFVQQELRIGNYLMDTGIDKKTLLAKQAQQYFRTDKDGRIRLTITTPDNVERCMEDESNASVGTGSIDDSAVEALEFEGSSNEINTTGNHKAAYSDTTSAPVQQTGENLFWNIMPSTDVKEGLSLSDLEKLHQGVKIINRKLERRSSSTSAQPACNEGGGVQSEMETSALTHERRASHLSLSDLITQNSMGKSDRMTWGIEPIKENVSLEEQLHFHESQKHIEREHGIKRQPTEFSNGTGNANDNGNGVVFVLGDNEPLINIKKSNEDLAAAGADEVNKVPMLCALHQRKHDATIAKKHSGMKFNFEQYPQIATNYMKNKNLNYELLMDKATKLEASEALKSSDSSVTLHQQKNMQQETAGSSSTTTLTSNATAVSDRCVICSSLSSFTYQTPSNATELEFETDEVHCYNENISNSAALTRNATLQPVNSAASIDTLKSSANATEIALPQAQQSGEMNSTTATSYTRKQTKRVPSQRSSISSVAAKCAAAKEQLLKLPMSGTKELSQEDEPPGDKLRAGFIPSLLLSVSDHYVSDMVLQGTCAPPNKWEMDLREDLALAARSASLISQPAENVAIVADMDKWDVRLFSSQAQQFPVGMSQLVSTMLETVQAMHAGGIQAYECLSYMEAKLQEIYLQSETLAAFLLETDRCRLSDITTPLQLSENDVPLLLSIAFIHTPKISRKCGISFR